MAIAAGAVMAMGQGMKYLVDYGLVAGQTNHLDRGVMVLFAIAVVLALASYSRFYLVTSIGERVVADLRKRAFRHILTLSPEYFEVTRTGEVLARLTNDTTLLQSVVGSSLPFAMRNLMLVVGGLVLLFVTSVELAGVILLVVPLVVLPIIFLGRRVRSLSRAAQGRIGEVTAEANETIHAIRTVQAYNHEQLDGERFDDHIEVAFAAALAWIRARARLTAIIMMLVFGAVCFGVWIGGYDVLNNEITAGQLLTFIFYAVVVASAVGGLGESWGDVQRAAGAMERLSELLETKPSIAPPASPLPLPLPARGAVSFENVSFNYPLRPERRAVEGLDLQVLPGEKLALVGPSGAGKTTVFQLLLRFYDPQSGRIRFDGVDITAAEPSAVRQRIGLVPQEPVIFSHTAMDNIRYGQPDRQRRCRARRCRSRLRRRIPRPAARRVANPAGRARRAAFGRPAPAHRDCARHPAQPLAAAAGRSHIGTGCGKRTGGAKGAGASDAGPHHHRHRPSPGHGAEVRPHRGDGSRPHRRHRQACRTGAPGRALCPACRPSVRPAAGYGGQRECAFQSGSDQAESA